jgi:hypothetical protein
MKMAPDQVREGPRDVAKQCRRTAAAAKPLRWSAALKL